MGKGARVASGIGVAVAVRYGATYFDDDWLATADLHIAEPLTALRQFWADGSWREAGETT